jgi:hypothetical protein
MQQIIEEICQNFYQLTEIQYTPSYIEKGVSHEPSSLIKNDEKGVYVFLISSETCFKVGKAGTDSQARWNSHHYNLDKTTPSTFTKSFLNDLDRFATYFSGTSKDELDRFKKIITSHLGEGFYFNKKSLKSVEKETFQAMKNEINIKGWVKANISRIEFKIENTNNKNFDLDLLEKLVAYYFKPIYEG